MDKRRILLVDDHDDLRASLEPELQRLGHDIVATDDRDVALARTDLEEFDLLISDLDDCASMEAADGDNHQPVCVPCSPDGVRPPGLIKAFKLGALNYRRRDYDSGEMRAIVETTLLHKLRFVDEDEAMPDLREMVEFELPSDIALMNSVLNYLLERVSRLGVIKPERSNLFIALDEAFVNAVKHGNRHDTSKLVRITADLSANEARFTVEDEGEGFAVQEIPDPCDPENLFKTSGRGVLLIYNIMDEVRYNERGNRLTMVKRPDEINEPKLIESLTPEDKEQGLPRR